MSATLITDGAVYKGTSVNVALTGGGLIVGIITGSGGDGNSITAATIDGVSGTLLGSVNSAPGGEEIVASIFSWADQGANASAPLAVTVGAGITGVMTKLYEWDSASVSDLVSTTYGGADPINTSRAVTGQTGKTILVFGAVSDGVAFSSATTVTNPSANLAGFTSDFNSKNWSAYGYDLDAATDPITYTMTFDPDAGSSGGAMDRGITGAFVVADPAPTTLTCDSITAGTIRAGDTVTIQLSNAINASGKTLSIPQGSITPSAQDINSISFIAPDFKTFGDKTGVYGVNTTITVADGAESDTIDFQLSPDVGDEVGAITAVEGIYAEAAFSGVAVTDLYYTATISGADFTVGAVPVLSTEQTFNLWIQDQTDGVWGAPFTITIPASSSGIPASSRGSVWNIGRYLQSTGTYNSSGINEIVMEWLIAEGIGRSQLNYMLYLYLEGLGYTGTLNDKLRKWSLDS